MTKPFWESFDYPPKLTERQRANIIGSKRCARCGHPVYKNGLCHSHYKQLSHYTDYFGYNCSVSGSLSNTGKQINAIRQYEGNIDDWG